MKDGIIFGAEMAEKRLENKVIVIAGGTRGVGRAAAEEFARQGAKVVIGDLDEEAAMRSIRLMRTYGSDGHFVYVDLRDIKYCKILFDEAYKKFEYLKGNKRIPRVKPNGEEYFYTEGAMPCPDNLEAPARTMLTSEGGISRTTHIVEDYKTKKIRLLTPIECERINCFPDNWTNTGMSDKKRNFMMGNALVVGVIERIGNELIRIINKED